MEPHQTPTGPAAPASGPMKSLLIRNLHFSPDAVASMQEAFATTERHRRDAGSSQQAAAPVAADHDQADDAKETGGVKNPSDGSEGASSSQGQEPVQKPKVSPAPQRIAAGNPRAIPLANTTAFLQQLAKRVGTKFSIPANNAVPLVQPHSVPSQKKAPQTEKDLVGDQQSGGHEDVKKPRSIHRVKEKDHRAGTPNQSDRSGDDSDGGAEPTTTDFTQLSDGLCHDPTTSDASSEHLSDWTSDDEAGPKGARPKSPPMESKKPVPVLDGTSSNNGDANNTDAKAEGEQEDAAKNAKTEQQQVQQQQQPCGPVLYAMMMPKPTVALRGPDGHEYCAAPEFPSSLVVADPDDALMYVADVEDDSDDVPTDHAAAMKEKKGKRSSPKPVRLGQLMRGKWNSVIIGGKKVMLRPRNFGLQPPVKVKKPKAAKSPVIVASDSAPESPLLPGANNGTTIDGQPGPGSEDAGPERSPKDSTDQEYLPDATEKKADDQEQQPAKNDEDEEAEMKDDPTLSAKSDTVSAKSDGDDGPHDGQVLPDRRGSTDDSGHDDDGDGKNQDDDATSEKSDTDSARRSMPDRDSDDENPEAAKRGPASSRRRSTILPDHDHDADDAGDHDDDDDEAKKRAIAARMEAVKEFLGDDIIIGETAVQVLSAVAPRKRLTCGNFVEAPDGKIAEAEKNDGEADGQSNGEEPTNKTNKTKTAGVKMSEYAAQPEMHEFFFDVTPDGYLRIVPGFDSDSALTAVEHHDGDAGAGGGSDDELKITLAVQPIVQPPSSTSNGEADDVDEDEKKDDEVSVDVEAVRAAMAAQLFEVSVLDNGNYCLSPMLHPAFIIEPQLGSLPATVDVVHESRSTNYCEIFALRTEKANVKMREDDELVTEPMRKEAVERIVGSMEEVPPRLFSIVPAAADHLRLHLRTAVVPVDDSQEAKISAGSTEIHGDAPGEQKEGSAPTLQRNRSGSAAPAATMVAPVGFSFEPAAGLGQRRGSALHASTAADTEQQFFFVDATRGYVGVVPVAAPNVACALRPSNTRLVHHDRVLSMRKSMAIDMLGQVAKRHHAAHAAKQRSSKHRKSDEEDGDDENLMEEEDDGLLVIGLVSTDDRCDMRSFNTNDCDDCDIVLASNDVGSTGQSGLEQGFEIVPANDGTGQFYLSPRAEPGYVLAANVPGTEDYDEAAPPLRAIPIPRAIHAAGITPDSQTMDGEDVLETEEAELYGVPPPLPDTCLFRIEAIAEAGVVSGDFNAGSVGLTAGSRGGSRLPSRSPSRTPLRSRASSAALPQDPNEEKRRQALIDIVGPFDETVFEILPADAPGKRLGVPADYAAANPMAQDESRVIDDQKPYGNETPFGQFGAETKELFQQNDANGGDDGDEHKQPRRQSSIRRRGSKIATGPPPAPVVVDTRRSATAASGQQFLIRDAGDGYVTVSLADAPDVVLTAQSFTDLNQDITAEEQEKSRSMMDPLVEAAQILAHNTLSLCVNEDGSPLFPDAAFLRPSDDSAWTFEPLRVVPAAAVASSLTKQKAQVLQQAKATSATANNAGSTRGSRTPSPVPLSRKHSETLTASQRDMGPLLGAMKIRDSGAVSGSGTATPLNSTTRRPTQTGVDRVKALVQHLPHPRDAFDPRQLFEVVSLEDGNFTLAPMAFPRSVAEVGFGSAPPSTSPQVDQSSAVTALPTLVAVPDLEATNYAELRLIPHITAEAAQRQKSIVENENRGALRRGVVSLLGLDGDLTVFEIVPADDSTTRMTIAPGPGGDEGAKRHMFNVADRPPSVSASMSMSREEPVSSASKQQRDGKPTPPSSAGGLSAGAGAAVPKHTYIRDISLQPRFTFDAADLDAVSPLSKASSNGRSPSALSPVVAQARYDRQSFVVVPAPSRDGYVNVIPWSVEGAAVSCGLSSKASVRTSETTLDKDDFAQEFSVLPALPPETLTRLAVEEAELEVTHETPFIIVPRQFPGTVLVVPSAATTDASGALTPTTSVASRLRQRRSTLFAQDSDARLVPMETVAAALRDPDAAKALPFVFRWKLQPRPDRAAKAEVVEDPLVALRAQRAKVRAANAAAVVIGDVDDLNLVELRAEPNVGPRVLKRSVKESLNVDSDDVKSGEDEDDSADEAVVFELDEATLDDPWRVLSLLPRPAAPDTDLDDDDRKSASADGDDEVDFDDPQSVRKLLANTAVTSMVSTRCGDDREVFMFTPGPDGFVRIVPFHNTEFRVAFIPNDALRTLEEQESARAGDLPNVVTTEGSKPTFSVDAPTPRKSGKGLTISAADIHEEDQNGDENSDGEKMAGDAGVAGAGGLLVAVPVDDDEDRDDLLFELCPVHPIPTRNRRRSTLKSAHGSSDDDVSGKDSDEDKDEDDSDGVTPEQKAEDEERKRVAPLKFRLAPKMANRERVRLAKAPTRFIGAVDFVSGARPAAALSDAVLRDVVRGGDVGRTPHMLQDQSASSAEKKDDQDDKDNGDDVDLHAVPRENALGQTVVFASCFTSADEEEAQVFSLELQTDATARAETAAELKQKQSDAAARRVAALRTVLGDPSEGVNDADAPTGADTVYRTFEVLPAAKRSYRVSPDCGGDEAGVYIMAAPRNDKGDGQSVTFVEVGTDGYVAMIPTHASSCAFSVFPTADPASASESLDSSRPSSSRPASRRNRGELQNSIVPQSMADAVAPFDIVLGQRSPAIAAAADVSAGKRRTSVAVMGQAMSAEERELLDSQLFELFPVFHTGVAGFRVVPKAYPDHAVVVKDLMGFSRKWLQTDIMQSERDFTEGRPQSRGNPPSPGKRPTSAGKPEFDTDGEPVLPLILELCLVRRAKIEHSEFAPDPNSPEGKRSRLVPSMAAAFDVIPIDVVRARDAEAAAAIKARLDALETIFGDTNPDLIDGFELLPAAGAAVLADASSVLAAAMTLGSDAAVEVCQSGLFSLVSHLTSVDDEGLDRIRALKEKLDSAAGETGQVDFNAAPVLVTEEASVQFDPFSNDRRRSVLAGESPLDRSGDARAAAPAPAAMGPTKFSVSHDVLYGRRRTVSGGAGLGGAGADHAQGEGASEFMGDVFTHYVSGRALEWISGRDLRVSAVVPRPEDGYAFGTTAQSADDDHDDDDGMAHPRSTLLPKAKSADGNDASVSSDDGAVTAMLPQSQIDAAKRSRLLITDRLPTAATAAREQARHVLPADMSKHHDTQHFTFSDAGDGFVFVSPFVAPETALEVISRKDMERRTHRRASLGPNAAVLGLGERSADRIVDSLALRLGPLDLSSDDAADRQAFEVVVLDAETKRFALRPKLHPHMLLDTGVDLFARVTDQLTAQAEAFQSAHNSWSDQSRDSVDNAPPGAFALARRKSTAPPLSTDMDTQHKAEAELHLIVGTESSSLREAWDAQEAAAQRMLELEQQLLAVTPFLRLVPATEATRASELTFRSRPEAAEADLETEQAEREAKRAAAQRRKKSVLHSVAAEMDMSEEFEIVPVACPHMRVTVDAATGVLHVVKRDGSDEQSFLLSESRYSDGGFACFVPIAVPGTAVAALTTKAKKAAVVAAAADRGDQPAKALHEELKWGDLMAAHTNSSGSAQAFLLQPAAETKTQFKTLQKQKSVLVSQEFLRRESIAPSSSSRTPSFLSPSTAQSKGDASKYKKRRSLFEGFGGDLVAVSGASDDDTDELTAGSSKKDTTAAEDRLDATERPAPSAALSAAMESHGGQSFTLSPQNRPMTLVSVVLDSAATGASRHRGGGVVAVGGGSPRPTSSAQGRKRLALSPASVAAGKMALCEFRVVPRSEADRAAKEEAALAKKASKERKRREDAIAKVIGDIDAMALFEVVPDPAPQHRLTSRTKAVAGSMVLCGPRLAYTSDRQTFIFTAVADGYVSIAPFSVVEMNLSLRFPDTPDQAPAITFNTQSANQVDASGGSEAPKKRGLYLAEAEEEDETQHFAIVLAKDSTGATTAAPLHGRPAFHLEPRTAPGNFVTDPASLEEALPVTDSKSERTVWHVVLREEAEADIAAAEAATKAGKGTAHPELAPDARQAAIDKCIGDLSQEDPDGDPFLTVGEIIPVSMDTRRWTVHAPAATASALLSPRVASNAATPRHGLLPSLGRASGSSQLSPTAGAGGGIGDPRRPVSRGIRTPLRGGAAARSTDLAASALGVSQALGAGQGLPLTFEENSAGPSSEDARKHAQRFVISDAGDGYVTISPLLFPNVCAAVAPATNAEGPGAMSTSGHGSHLGDGVGGSLSPRSPQVSGASAGGGGLLSAGALLQSSHDVSETRGGPRFVALPGIRTAGTSQGAPSPSAAAAASRGGTQQLDRPVVMTRTFFGTVGSNASFNASNAFPSSAAAMELPGDGEPGLTIKMLRAEAGNPQQAFAILPEFAPPSEATDDAEPTMTGAFYLVPKQYPTALVDLETPHDDAHLAQHPRPMLRRRENDAAAPVTAAFRFVPSSVADAELRAAKDAREAAAAAAREQGIVDVLGAMLPAPGEPVPSITSPDEDEVAVAFATLPKQIAVVAQRHLRWSALTSDSANAEIARANEGAEDLKPREIIPADAGAGGGVLYACPMEVPIIEGDDNDADEAQGPLSPRSPGAADEDGEVPAFRPTRGNLLAAGLRVTPSSETAVWAEDADTVNAAKLEEAESVKWQQFSFVLVDAAYVALCCGHDGDLAITLETADNSGDATQKAQTLPHALVISTDVGEAAMPAPEATIAVKTFFLDDVTQHFELVPLAEGTFALAPRTRPDLVLRAAVSVSESAAVASTSAEGHPAAFDIGSIAVSRVSPLVAVPVATADDLCVFRIPHSVTAYGALGNDTAKAEQEAKRREVIREKIGPLPAHRLEIIPSASPKVDPMRMALEVTAPASAASSSTDTDQVLVGRAAIQPRYIAKPWYLIDAPSSGVGEKTVLSEEAASHRPATAARKKRMSVFVDAELTPEQATREVFLRGRRRTTAGLDTLGEPQGQGTTTPPPEGEVGGSLESNQDLDEQRWTIVDAGEGYVRLEPEHTPGYCLALQRTGDAPSLERIIGEDAATPKNSDVADRQAAIDAQRFEVVLLTQGHIGFSPVSRKSVFLEARLLKDGLPVRLCAADSLTNFCEFDIVSRQHADAEYRSVEEDKWNRDTERREATNAKAFATFEGDVSNTAAVVRPVAAAKLALTTIASSRHEAHTASMDDPHFRAIRAPGDRRRRSSSRLSGSDIFSGSDLDATMLQQCTVEITADHFVRLRFTASSSSTPNHLSPDNQPVIGGSDGGVSHYLTVPAYADTTLSNSGGEGSGVRYAVTGADRERLLKEQTAAQRKSRRSGQGKQGGKGGVAHSPLRYSSASSQAADLLLPIPTGSLTLDPDLSASQESYRQLFVLGESLLTIASDGKDDDKDSAAALSQDLPKLTLVPVAYQHCFLEAELSKLMVTAGGQELDGDVDGSETVEIQDGNKVTIKTSISVNKDGEKIITTSKTVDPLTEEQEAALREELEKKKQAKGAGTKAKGRATLRLVSSVGEASNFCEFVIAPFAKAQDALKSASDAAAQRKAAAMAIVRLKQRRSVIADECLAKGVTFELAPLETDGDRLTALASLKSTDVVSSEFADVRGGSVAGPRTLSLGVTERRKKGKGQVIKFLDAGDGYVRIMRFNASTSPSNAKVSFLRLVWNDGTAAVHATTLQELAVAVKKTQRSGDGFWEAVWDDTDSEQAHRGTLWMLSSTGDDVTTLKSDDGAPRAFNPGRFVVTTDAVPFVTDEITAQASVLIDKLASLPKCDDALSIDDRRRMQRPPYVPAPVDSMAVEDDEDLPPFYLECVLDADEDERGVKPVRVVPESSASNFTELLLKPTAAVKAADDEEEQKDAQRRRDMHRAIFGADPDEDKSSSIAAPLRYLAVAAGGPEMCLTAVVTAEELRRREWLQQNGGVITDSNDIEALLPPNVSDVSVDAKSINGSNVPGECFVAPRVPLTSDDALQLQHHGDVSVARQAWRVRTVPGRHTVCLELARFDTDDARSVWRVAAPQTAGMPCELILAEADSAVMEQCEFELTPALPGGAARRVSTATSHSALLPVVKGRAAGDPDAASSGPAPDESSTRPFGLRAVSTGLLLEAPPPPMSLRRHRKVSSGSGKHRPQPEDDLATHAVMRLPHLAPKSTGGRGDEEDQDTSLPRTVLAVAERPTPFCVFTAPTVRGVIALDEAAEVSRTEDNTDEAMRRFSKAFGVDMATGTPKDATISSAAKAWIQPLLRAPGPAPSDEAPGYLTMCAEVELLSGSQGDRILLPMKEDCFLEGTAVSVGPRTQPDGEVTVPMVGQRHCIVCGMHSAGYVVLATQDGTHRLTMSEDGRRLELAQSVDVAADPLSVRSLHVLRRVGSSSSSADVLLRTGDRNETLVVSLSTIVKQSRRGSEKEDAARFDRFARQCFSLVSLREGHVSLSPRVATPATLEQNAGARDRLGRSSLTPDAATKSFNSSFTGGEMAAAHASNRAVLEITSDYESIVPVSSHFTARALFVATSHTACCDEAASKDTGVRDRRFAAAVEWRERGFDSAAKTLPSSSLEKVLGEMATAPPKYVTDDGEATATTTDVLILEIVPSAAVKRRVLVAPFRDGTIAAHGVAGAEGSTAYIDVLPTTDAHHVAVRISPETGLVQIVSAADPTLGFSLAGPQGTVAQALKKGTVSISTFGDNAAVAKDIITGKGATETGSAAEELELQSQFTECTKAFFAETPLTDLSVVLSTVPEWFEVVPFPNSDGFLLIPMTKPGAVLEARLSQRGPVPLRFVEQKAASNFSEWCTVSTVASAQALRDKDNERYAAVAERRAKVRTEAFAAGLPGDYFAFCGASPDLGLGVTDAVEVGTAITGVSLPPAAKSNDSAATAKCKWRVVPSMSGCVRLRLASAPDLCLALAAKDAGAFTLVKKTVSDDTAEAEAKAGYAALEEDLTLLELSELEGGKWALMSVAAGKKMIEVELDTDEMRCVVVDSDQVTDFSEIGFSKESQQ